MATDACHKRPYDSQGEAVGAAKAAMRRGVLPLRAYRCEQCRTASGKRYWHIGHKAPKYKRLGMGRRP